MKIKRTERFVRIWLVIFLVVILLENGGTEYRLYAITGDGSIVPGWPVSNGTTYVGGHIVGDIDGDGYAEVIFTSSDGKVHAFHSDGSPVSGFPLSATNGEGSSYGYPALGDLDLDGDIELVAASRGRRTVYVWDLPGAYNPDYIEWGKAHHDLWNTGLYGFNPEEALILQPSLRITEHSRTVLLSNELLGVNFEVKSGNSFNDVSSVQYRFSESDSWRTASVRGDGHYFLSLNAPSQPGNYTLTIRAKVNGKWVSDSLEIQVVGIDLSIESVKAIQVVEDVDLVAGKDTVVRVTVVNSSGIGTNVKVKINYNGWVEEKTVFVEDRKTVNFFPPNDKTR